MEFEITPQSATYEPGDPRWSSQVVALRQSLSEVAPLDMSGQSRLGYKGVVEAMILTIGSSGILTQLIAGLELWLNRDQDRSATVSWKDAGEERSVQVTSDTISDESLRSALERAIGQANADKG